MQDSPTTLWKVRRDEDEASCLVRLMPYGIEVDIVRNGKVVLTRVFETDHEALGWAQGKQSARESEGWTLLPAEAPTDQRPVA